MTALESRDRVLRWVTWWPMPYWTDRFDELYRRLGPRFEAVFLAAAPAHYDGLELRPEAWEFRYRILSNGASSIGFNSHAKVPRNPFPLVAGGRATTLVMSYADPTFLAAALLARARRVPYYLLVSNTVQDARIASARNERLKRWIFARSAGCFATGPDQEEYARIYAPNAEIALVGNPVDNARLDAEARVLTPRRGALRLDHGFADDHFVVLFVGRLSPEKDIATLLRAAVELRDAPHRVTVLLVGAGPERARLGQLAATLGVDVRFAGLQQGRDLHEMYAIADVLVLPSLSEPWGLVVNEAMAFGLPVAVSDRTGARHLVNGGGGFVFPAGDVPALAEILGALNADVELRRSVGDAARKAIERHGIDRWADTVLRTVGMSG